VETLAYRRADVAPSLERLAREAQRGDADAFAGIYRALLPRLNSWLRHRARTLEADADDLSHQILTKVYRGLATYDPDRGGFLNWVFAVARNELSSEHRSRRALRLVGGEEVDRRREEQEASDAGDAMSRVAERDELRHWFRSLTTREAQTLALRYFADLSLAEVAVVFGISEDAVSQTQRRALVKLRRIVSEGPPEAPPALAASRHPARRRPHAVRRERMHVFTLLPRAA
jgi:RNA polymerase sigma-70 factor (ECF subfamily)